jgi:hypothetical protein
MRGTPGPNYALPLQDMQTMLSTSTDEETAGMQNLFWTRMMTDGYFSEQLDRSIKGNRYMRGMALHIGVMIHTHWNL